MVLSKIVDDTKEVFYIWFPEARHRPELWTLEQIEQSTKWEGTDFVEVVRTMKLNDRLSYEPLNITVTRIKPYLDLFKNSPKKRGS